MEGEVQFGKTLDLTGIWHSLSRTDDGHSPSVPTVLKPVTAVTAPPEASRVSHHGSHKYLHLIPTICASLHACQGTKGTSDSAQ